MAVTLCLGSVWACQLLEDILPAGVIPGTGRDAAVPPWIATIPDESVDNWKAVWAPRHDTAYFVGDNGAIMKWTGDNGGEFTRLASGTTANLESIWGRTLNDVTDIFAVGAGGVVLHSTGGDFAPILQDQGDGGIGNPTSLNLFAVFGDGDRVYFAGERGEILAQNADGGVSRMDNETTLQIYPVCESRVVDITDTMNGPTCTTQAVPQQDANGNVFFDPAVTYPSCGTPPECCTFAGDPMYCCYPQRCDADGGPLTGRIGVDADLKTGWAQGNYAVVCGGGGAIYELGDGPDGYKWYKNELAPNVPFSRDALASSWGFSPETVYCAGQDGRLMRKRSGSWNPDSIPTPAFVQGIWGTGTRDLYAVGFSGVLLRYDGYPTTDAGVGWFQEPIAVGEHLRAVTGVRLDFDGGLPTPDPALGPPPSRVFVVGANGKVLIKNGPTR